MLAFISASVSSHALPLTGADVWRLRWWRRSTLTGSGHLCLRWRWPWLSARARRGCTDPIIINHFCAMLPQFLIHSKYLCCGADKTHEFILSLSLPFSSFPFICICVYVCIFYSIEQSKARHTHDEKTRDAQQFHPRVRFGSGGTVTVIVQSVLRERERARERGRNNK